MARPARLVVPSVCDVLSATTFALDEMGCKTAHQREVTQVRFRQNVAYVTALLDGVGKSESENPLAAKLAALAEYLRSSDVGSLLHSPFPARVAWERTSQALGEHLRGLECLMGCVPRITYQGPDCAAQFLLNVEQFLISLDRTHVAMATAAAAWHNVPLIENAARKMGFRAPIAIESASSGHARVVVRSPSGYPETFQALPGCSWMQIVLDNRLPIAISLRQWCVAVRELAANHAESTDSAGTTNRRLEPAATADSTQHAPCQHEAASRHGKVRRAHFLAFHSYQYAEFNLGAQCKDGEAYEWLKEQCFDVDRSDEFAMLADYQLPTRLTWLSYLSKGRSAFGEKKRNFRVGREGRSAVRASEL